MMRHSDVSVKSYKLSLYIAMKTASVRYLYEVRNRQWPQIVQINHVWLKFEVKVHSKKRLLKAAEALEEKKTSWKMFQQILFWKITIQRGTSSNHFTFLQQSKALQIMLLNIMKIATDKSIRHQNEDYVMYIFHIRTNKSCSGSRRSHLTKTPGHQISCAAASGGSRGADCCYYSSQKKSKIGRS